MATLHWAIYAALGVVGLGFAWVAGNFVTEGQRNPRRLPLPPGPRGLPFIGNVLDIPQEQQWEGYHELCKQYGDVVYLNALGVRILVVGTLDRAIDLLEKRAVNYSDRPALAVLRLTTASEWNFALMPYGTRWRKLRRTFHDFFNPTTIPQFRPIMIEEVHRCLGRLKDRPEDFLDHVRLFFGTMAMRASYGFVDPARNESLVKYAEHFVEGLGEAIKPAKLLVNIFPSLQYTPDWFPGAGWKQGLKDLAATAAKMRWQSFEDAKANADRKYPSMAASLADILPEENDPAREEMESLSRDASVMAYIGGADTTAAAATGLILALAMYPEVQKKAHAELDSVIGTERLPLIDDLPALPYTHAIVKEISRWFTVVPMGVGHLSVADDEYNGYFIPKGTIVMPNVWAMMHNPEIFEKPFEFQPERYLRDGQIDPTVLDGEQAVFGFGRRICPGRHFGNETLFLLAASILSTFRIEPPKDDAGNVTPLELKISNHFVCKPLPFRCSFRMRPGRENLVR